MGILLNRAKNYIINGGMDFWQRNTSFASVATSTYVADRFQYEKSGTMVHAISRDTDVPTPAQANFTLPYSLKATLTTPQAVISAGNHCAINQKIEGQIFAPLAGKTITLSFWVKASLAGTYCVAFRNTTAATRSLIRTYTINAANTWEKKSITITHDVSGTWNYNIGIGLVVSWVLASGTTYQTSAENVWVDGNFIAISSQVNGVQSGATDFKVTGLQLEEGESASNFERAGGNIAQELYLCQRYYEKSYEVNTPTGTTSGRGLIVKRTIAVVGNGLHIDETQAWFKVTKRTLPSCQCWSTSGIIGNFDVGGHDRAVDIASYGSEIGIRNVANISGIQWSAGIWYQFYWAADAEL